MRRELIDQAGLAQFDRRLSLLRSVQAAASAKVGWSHLHELGHKFPTVKHAINSGYLIETSAYHYELTDSGRRFLDDVDRTALMRT